MSTVWILNIIWCRWCISSKSVLWKIRILGICIIDVASALPITSMDRPKPWVINIIDCDMIINFEHVIAGWVSTVTFAASIDQMFDLTLELPRRCPF